MRILLNGLTQRPGGGMVVLQGLVSGIAGASESVELVVIVYDETVYSLLSGMGFTNVRVVQCGKYTDLYDKLSVPFRVRSAGLEYQCDVVITLNFHVPNLPIPQIVYHVDLERFESHSIFPLSKHSVLERIRDRSARRALLKANANVFESNYVLNAAITHSNIDIVNPSVIYIGINGDTVVQSDSHSSEMVDGLLVVVTSPLTYKNNKALVPIMVKLLEKAPDVDWTLRLFGGKDISVWKDLIQLAKQAEVEERFQFMGYQSRDVLNESLDTAICELNPSLLESFCMVALEAMARGCPVIVSAEAAMPESVGTAGIVLDPNDTLVVVDRILELRVGGSERDAIKNASAEWASQLTWQQSGHAFYALCNELCVDTNLIAGTE